MCHGYAYMYVLSTHVLFTHASAQTHLHTHTHTRVHST